MTKSSFKKTTKVDSFSETKEKPLISIVVPVLNEEKSVKPLYNSVKAVMDSVADEYKWEIIFTDNHSEDKTFEVLKGIVAVDKNVCVYRFSRNFGFQHSIYTGYMMARGDAAIQLDCDLQDPPSLILEFLRLWKQGYQVVYGIRRSRRENFLTSRARSCFYRLIDKISEGNLPHDAGDFRLIDRRVINELSKYTDRSPYLRGIIADIGFKQIGVSYDRGKRVHGNSKFNLNSLINLGIDGIVSNSVVPLRFSLYFGILTGIGCIAVSIAFIVFRFFGDYNWPAGFVFLAVSILMSLAINLIVLGIFFKFSIIPSK